MRNPDFLIVGAQKAGTGMLWHLLGQHPQIALPEHKEYHYFNRDISIIPGGWPNHAAYRGHFAGRGALTGEATPGYCFWPGAMDRISAFDPYRRIKIIMLLRNPVKRAISHYWMEYNRGFETLPIDQAVVPLDQRLASEHAKGLDYALFYHSYLLRGIYHTQLDKIYSIYPSEQAFVGAAEAMWTKPDEFMDGIAGFLDLDTPFGELDVTPKHVGEYPPPSETLIERLQAFFEEPNRLLREKHGIIA